METQIKLYSNTKTIVFNDKKAVVLEKSSTGWVKVYRIERATMFEDISQWEQISVNTSIYSVEEAMLFAISAIN